ncbi:hypothetical protein SAMN04487850_0599 [Prevotella aff. ruminicola Tc2-24]|jgi:hypothetical protein|uniref:Uncharacterized protein n=1 Tax=Prevotella aff. ruminicola Tc2-24 TaxID=81582 RepID=A0A1I0MEG0_9BACT|nr:hypothetical protein SAMN04487850_0599 [Prevotella aff. ruminicola Tc2-24]
MGSNLREKYLHSKEQLIQNNSGSEELKKDKALHFFISCTSLLQFFFVPLHTETRVVPHRSGYSTLK